MAATTSSPSEHPATTAATSRSPVESAELPFPARERDGRTDADGVVLAWASYFPLGSAGVAAAGAGLEVAVLASLAMNSFSVTAFKPARR